MKKGKGPWLPLALILAAGSALLAMGCDNGDDPAKTDPIPDETQVTFDGKPIKVVPAADNINGDYDTGTHKGKWHRVTIRWEDTFQNQIDKFSITWGKDYLEGEADTLFLFLEGKEDENAVISKADYAALMAKFQAALPADSGKNMRVQDDHHNVTIVEQYPIPELTSVKFNGQNIYLHSSATEGLGDQYHMMTLRWKEEFKNNIDKISVILGKDYLEDGKAVITPMLYSPDGQPLTISKADYTALRAKIRDAIPPDVWKYDVTEAGLHVNVTVVEQYAAMIKNALIRMAQGVKANFARGA